MSILDNRAAEPGAGEPDDDAARLERLRAAIQVGLDDFARGDVEVVTDITAWLHGLGRREG